MIMIIDNFDYNNNSNNDNNNLGQIGAGRLPPADQLPWLVSEEDAPQQLLPLPDSLPVDPEDDLKVRVLWHNDPKCNEK